MAIPVGYTELDKIGIFNKVFAPWYVNNSGAIPKLGLTIRPELCSDSRGVCHGGVLLSVADFAMFNGIRNQLDDQSTQVFTISLSTDFTKVVKVGDFIEAETTILKSGKSVVFAQCFITVNGVLVLRANGTYSLVKSST
jgi:uncharacterized protein (TIGR00369 family)